MNLRTASYTFTLAARRYYFGGGGLVEARSTLK